VRFADRLGVPGIHGGLVTEMRWLLYLSILFLFALHNDVWLWSNAGLVMGLPVGLMYHILYCVATTVLMALLVLYAWPRHLEANPEE